MKFKQSYFFILLEISSVFTISSNRDKKKDEPLLVTSPYVISSQNTSILFSDDYHCNALIKDDILYEFSNGEFSVLTRRISLKPNIEDFRNFQVTSNDIVIIDTNIIKGCNQTNLNGSPYLEVCVNLVFEVINAVDSSVSVEILYQYEAVSILKSELKPYTRTKFNTLSFTLDNENNYHINNIQINVTFDFFKKPNPNFTFISPENNEVYGNENAIFTISWVFFEIRNKEEWQIHVVFDEIMHGCLDSKSFIYNNEKDSNYLMATWVILIIFFFLIMLILYCGEIGNLNKKLK